MKLKCYCCKKDLEKLKPKFIFTIQENSIIGYTTYQFCSHKCLCKWFVKRFKYNLRRIGY